MTEFRPGSFQILPTIIKNLIIINVLIFLVQKFVAPSLPFSLEDWFALHSWQSELFKPWQLITHLFMHSTDDPMHLIGNMFALWIFGSVLENLWGPQRFLIFYLVCGLGAALCHLIVLYIENQSMIAEYNHIIPAASDYMQRAVAFISKYGNGYRASPEQILMYNINEPTIGASGAVFGCLAAFGYLFPNDYVYFYFLVPVKAKWLVLGYTGYELFQAIQNSAGDSVAHVAHLGGALFGVLLVWFWNRNNRRNFY